MHSAFGRSSTARFTAAVALTLSVSPAVLGQAEDPTLFVGNAFAAPGPFGGSVSSMRIFEDGTLELIHTVSFPESYCVAVDVSPNGRWLLVRVGTAPNIRLYEVHPDATFSEFNAFNDPGDGALRWLRDDLVAVGSICFTAFCAPVRLYRIDPERDIWELVTAPLNLFGGPFHAFEFGVHPSREWFTVHDEVGAFALLAVPTRETPELAAPLATGEGRHATYSPDGLFLYNVRPLHLDAFEFDAGVITPVTPDGFPTGTLQSNAAAVSGDGAFIAVRSLLSHAVCVHDRDAVTGAVGAPIGCVTPGTAAFGGGIVALDRLILSTVASPAGDGPSGIVSLSISPNNELLQNGPLHGAEPGGVGDVPSFLSLWNPSAARELVGDLNGDGIVDGADLGILLNAWGQDGGPADLNRDGVVDGADLGILLAAWGAR